jgi:hypothetical protein
MRHIANAILEAVTLVENCDIPIVDALWESCRVRKLTGNETKLVFILLTSNWDESQDWARDVLELAEDAAKEAEQAAAYLADGLHSEYWR